jgi:hypothetical protein
MALVNVLNLNAQCLGCLIDNLLTLRTENIGGRPDGNTDLDLAVVSLSSC